jgi:hypothetical protein
MTGMHIDRRQIITGWMASAFFLVSCSSGPMISTSSDAVTEAVALPVFAYAQCTLMGGKDRTKIPRNRPLVVLWGWTAASEQQMRDYIRMGTATVVLDGKELSGTMKGDIRYDESARVYRALWSADAGVPAAGTHILTYQVEFAGAVSDGTGSFGPGTDRETLTDRCFVEVR